MGEAPRLHRIEPGSTVDVRDLPTDDTSAAPGDKKATNAATDELADRLAELQEMLWANDERKVLVVLQGMYTSGKGGTVEHVFGAVNPVGLRIASFKKPTTTELERDYLWRVHAQVPGTGEIGIFDRSHYEDVLVVRVKGLVAEPVWKRRYGHIRDWERMLTDEGIHVVKFFLNTSKDKQRERLQDRIDDPEERWKFRIGDLDDRARWDDYQAAFQAALRETSTPDAPWYVVPGDRKWVRNLAVARVLRHHLERIDPQWPPADDDVAGLVVT